MKAKTLSYLVIVLGVCFSFAGFTNGAELKFNTQDFAPFNYEVGVVVSGPVADIIRKICSEMKIDCLMHLLPWRGAQEEVANGIAQGLFTIVWPEELAPGKPRFPTPPWSQR